jgi:hypothetical protein
MTETALYRHFDDVGVLLYVGISLSPINRLAAHMDSSSWANRIARVDVEWHDTRELAIEAERVAIANESPKHNVQHAGDNPVAAFVAKVGRDKLCRTLGVGKSAISAAAVKGQMPACWARVIAQICRTNEISCPASVFSWKGRQSITGCISGHFEDTVHSNSSASSPAKEAG